MKRLCATLSATVVAAFSVGVTAQSSLSYTFTTVDDPAANTAAGERTSAFGINDAGAIVGDFGGHGFLLTGGIFTTIDVPGASYTHCAAINNAGQMVGTFGDSAGAHGFLYSRGTFTTIDVPGAGTVNGAATRAQGINASGDIVGDFDDNTGTHGYRYRHGALTIIDVPGAYSTQALGLNATGDIVGITAFPNVGGDSAFILSHGNFTVINNPAATSPGSVVTTATAINNLGQVVGFFTDAGAYRAFVYDDGTFTEIDLPPGADNESFAYGIDDAGRVVGYFNSATGDHGFFAEPTRQP